MELSWQREFTTFKFRLGEYSVFKLKLDTLVFDRHFSDVSLKMHEELPNLKQLISGDRVMLIRSCPVDKYIPIFSFHSGYIRYVPYKYRRYYVKMSCSFEEYLKKFNSRSKSTLMRKIRKFSDYCNGTIDCREYKYPAEVEEFYKHAQFVSKNTYQSRLLACGFPEGGKTKEELARLAKAGAMRGFVLFHETSPVAYLYSPVKDNIVYYRFVGYDTDYQRHSPGTILQFLALQKLFSEKQFRMFDFTEGEGQHKEFFSTDVQPCADIYYFKFGLKNILIVLVHAFFDRSSRLIVKILDVFKLKSRIKKHIRARA